MKPGCLVLPLMLALHGIALAATDLRPEDIHRVSLEYWKLLRQGEYAKTDSFVADGVHLASAALAAATDVRAAEWTGDKSYFESAATRLKEVARRGLKTNEADFFTSFPFAWAYAHVDQVGFADPELKQLAGDYAESKFKPRDEGMIFNQTFIRACGLAMAAKNWPHSTMTAEWSRYANAILDGFLALQDTPENSTDYNAFDLMCPFLLADLLNRTDDLKKDGVKKYYERFMAQVSPAGFIPPYGDAGAAPKEFTPDWPVDNAWGFYVSAFERAGAFWKEPQFRWVADRMFQAGSQHQKLTRSYADLQELFYLTFAADWMDPKLPPEMPSLSSQILTRTDQTGQGQLDKLLLASSHAPGTPYLLADLYARGPHAHENQPGAIVYYEFGDQPLLASLGYNNRNPEEANLTVMQDAGGPFPFVDGLFTPDVWHETKLPTSRLPVISKDHPEMRRIKDVVLRVTGGNQGVEATISRLELIDTAGRPKTIDALDDPAMWTGPVSATKADGALSWRLPKGVTFLNRNDRNLDFDSQVYPNINIRWKLSNNDERARPLILRLGPGMDYRVCIPQLAPQLVSAQTETRDGVQFGCVTYAGWFTPQSRLTRQIAVFPDGMLLVRDLLLPGQDATQQRAGQIWHFMPLSQPESDGNWFNTTGGKNDLLVFFNSMPGREYAAHTTEIWSKAAQQSVCASEIVQPGQPQAFTTVLIPHPHDKSAAELASQILITGDAAVTRVEIKQPAGIRSLVLGEGMDWKCNWSREIDREKKLHLTMLKGYCKLQTVFPSMRHTPSHTVSLTSDGHRYNGSSPSVPAMPASSALSCQASQRAFSLVEVTIAIGLMSFCLVAMLGVLPVGLSQEKKSVGQLATLQALNAVVADFQNATAGATNTAMYKVQIPAIGQSAVSNTLILDQNLGTNAAAKEFDVTCKVEAPSSRFSNYRLSIRVVRSPQANVAANLDTYGTDYMESVVLKSAL